MHKHKCRDCKLKSAAANTLTEKEFEVLENNSIEVGFKKGEIIIKQDALSLNIAYLKTGMVKLHLHGPTKEKILKIIKAPVYLGIPTSFGEKINQFSATALEDTTVCFIDSNLFRDFIYKNGRFAYEIIVELCKAELSDYQRSASQAQKQVPGLVAEALLCMSEKIYESDVFEIPLTRSELGDMIGASRESISREIANLSNNGIISVAKNKLKIINKENLYRISQKG